MLYVGIYTVDPHFGQEIGEKIRSGNLELKPYQIPEPLGAKARELAGKLPQGCKIVARWVPATGAPSMLPGIMAVETDDISHLAWISNYYGGLLMFDWRPYIPVPV